MLEMILAGVGTLAASAAVVVTAARSYEGGWSDEDLAALNRERRERAAQTGPGYLSYDAERGYYATRPDGTPSGYHGAVQPQGDGTYKITSADGIRREPPPYDGPRGRGA